MVDGNVQIENAYDEASSSVMVTRAMAASAAAAPAPTATSIGMNAMHFNANNAMHASSTSSSYSSASSSSSSINPIDHEMSTLDERNRQKIDHKIDIDDTCSNDAFVFNSSLKEKPMKSNQKTATVPCNAPK